MPFPAGGDLHGSSSVLKYQGKEEVMSLKVKRILVEDHPERPDPVTCHYECDRCGRPIKITLQWWRDGDCWVLDTPDTLDVNERLCDRCFDRKMRVWEESRELMADLPPSWFDPANAGESWDEDW